MVVVLAAQLLAVSGAPPGAQAGPAGPPSQPASQRYLYLPTLWRDPAIPEVCNASSPWWKATPGNPANYIFCSKQDLEYVAGWPSILHFNRGDTRRYAKRQMTWIAHQFTLWPRIPSLALDVRTRVFADLHAEAQNRVEPT